MQTKVEPLILEENPWPEKALTWPQSRHLSDYLYLLLAPWSFKSLSQTLMLADVTTLLLLAWAANLPTQVECDDNLLERINPDNKPIVVDIGLGDANALKEIKELQDVVTIGFGLHEINDVNAKSLNLTCYSPVPRGVLARKVFESLRGRVSLLLEAFGASTYADGEANPIEALIFEGLLLAPGGTAKIIVSSILGEDTEQSPIGFAYQRNRLVQFFKDELGLKMVISRTHIKSAITGEVCIDFHVEIKRLTDAKVTDKSLNELFELAKDKIGKCTLIPKSTKVGEFKGFGIRGRTYTLHDEVIQFESINIAQGIQTRSIQLSGTDYPSFTLVADSNQVLDEFITRFSEYYLNNWMQPDWNLEVDITNKTIELMYCGSASNRLEALAQAKIEINRIFPNFFAQIKPIFFSEKQKESALENYEDQANLNLR